MECREEDSSVTDTLVGKCLLASTFTTLETAASV